jgi:hypothetical protein
MMKAITYMTESQKVIDFTVNLGKNIELIEGFLCPRNS